ncbi:MAG: S8 family serine peptidase, partial [Chloroflexi bacterium]|nr:S8 family serine peptidase [Chloroflexota bacterium]
VGAVRYSVPVTIARYSGRGPTEDGRTKPDLVATDGVCVSGAGGFKAANPSCQGDGRRFSGTSAAAPHVAGIAALLLQCNVSLSREELRDALLNNADDLGPDGVDGVYGHGRVNALASANAVQCGAPTPTATGTPTHTPTPSVTPHATPRCATGDVNRDRRVNSVDASLVLQFVARRVSILTCPEGADVNVDGRINSIDAALVLQFEAGLLGQLPP